MATGGPSLQALHARGQRCDTCKSHKPLQQFRFSRTEPLRGGYSRTCLDCIRRRQRDRQLQRLYGITAKDYDRLLAKQRGGCAICRRPCTSGRRLAVDHDHQTGKVRGLLCGKCNVAVGLMADDISRFVAAARYLHEASPDA